MERQLGIHHQGPYYPGREKLIISWQIVLITRQTITKPFISNTINPFY